MRITIDRTSKVVELVIQGRTIPAEIWEGTTVGGQRVYAHVTRLGVLGDDGALPTDDPPVDPSEAAAALPATCFIASDPYVPPPEE